MKLACGVLPRVLAIVGPLSATFDSGRQEFDLLSKVLGVLEEPVVRLRLPTVGDDLLPDNDRQMLCDIGMTLLDLLAAIPAPP
jgi:hypothetical protein